MKKVDPRRGKLDSLKIWSLMLALLMAALYPAGPRVYAEDSAWAPGAAYAAKATVTYAGGRYECLQGHTSTAGWEPPNVPALWRPIAAAPSPTASPTASPTPVPTSTPSPSPSPIPSSTSIPTASPSATPSPTSTVRPTAAPGAGAATPVPLRTISCSASSCLSSALKNAAAGDRIELAAGTYTGSFSSGSQGTAVNPIVLTSADASNPAILSGYSAGSGYALNIKGNRWIVSSLKFTNAQKGIILDQSNDSLITRVEVYNIGYEGVHFRDGSSRGRIEDSWIHDTGVTGAGYGEGVYVGSAEGASYNQAVYDTVISGVRFGPNVRAEHVDIKERTLRTVVENCSFDGTGISGANYADSFIDVKGNDAVVRGNTGYRNGNAALLDAFQLHKIVDGWGVNNRFSGNKVYMDGPAGYVINAASGTQAYASNNERSPSGDLYAGDVGAG
ncbi:carbohydrate-binding protein [Paenibacillus humicus]|uniref:carbohydrate-binding protein n=1 Tax=Paenibacillus humicus TaxID=412861 RepID=UPI000FDBB440|nr:carbohydrate-binding protein [Paenibacillus humicus]